MNDFNDLTPQQLEALKKHITTPLEESGLQDVYLYHGTTENHVPSVKAGPKNVGQGFGGRGLYCCEDIAAADEFASIAAGFKGNAVILQGRLNPDPSLRIAEITVKPRAIGAKPNLLNGIFPAEWAKNPRFEAFMKENFDVVIVNGAKTGGYATAPNRFAVFHESAGNKVTFHWEPKLVKATTGVRSIANAKMLTPLIAPQSGCHSLPSPLPERVKLFNSSETTLGHPIKPGFKQLARTGPRGLLSIAKTLLPALPIAFYSADLWREYQKNPEGDWFNTATTGFAADILVYGSLFVTAGWPSMIPMALSVIHASAQHTFAQQAEQLMSHAQKTSTDWRDTVDLLAQMDATAQSGSLYVATAFSNEITDTLDTFSQSLQAAFLEADFNPIDCFFEEDDTPPHKDRKKDAPPHNDAPAPYVPPSEPTDAAPPSWTIEERDGKRYAHTTYDLNNYNLNDQQPIPTSTAADPAAFTDPNPAAPPTPATSDDATATPVPMYTGFISPEKPPAPPFSDQFRITKSWVGPTPGGGQGLNIELAGGGVVGIGVYLTMSGGGSGGIAASGMSVGIAIPLGAGFSEAFLAAGIVGAIAAAGIFLGHHFYNKDQQRKAKTVAHDVERSTNHNNDLFNATQTLSDEVENRTISHDAFMQNCSDIHRKIETERAKVKTREFYAFNNKRYVAVFEQMAADWQLNMLDSQLLHMQKNECLRRSTDAQFSDSSTLTIDTLVNRLSELTQKGQRLTIPEWYEAKKLQEILHNKLREDLPVNVIATILQLASSNCIAPISMPHYEKAMEAPPTKCFHGDRHQHDKKVECRQLIDNLLHAYWVVEDVAAGKRTDLNLASAIQLFDKAYVKAVSILPTYTLHKQKGHIKNTGDHYKPFTDSLFLSVREVERLAQNLIVPILSPETVRVLQFNELIGLNAILEDPQASPEDKQRAFNLLHERAVKLLQQADNTESDNDYLSSHIKNWELVSGNYAMLDGVRTIAKMRDLSDILSGEGDSETKNVAFKQLYECAKYLDKLAKATPEFKDLINNCAEDGNSPKPKDVVTEYIAKIIGNYELVDGRYGLLEQIGSLEALCRDKNFAEAYRLSKEIKSTVSKPELLKLCDAAIIESYQRNSTLYRTPAAATLMHMLQDQTQRYGGAIPRACVGVFDVAHHLFPTAATDLLSIPSFAYHGDLAVWQQMTCDHLQKQLKDHLDPKNNKMRTLQTANTIIQFTYHLACDVARYAASWLGWELSDPRIERLIKTIEDTVKYVSMGIEFVGIPANIYSYICEKEPDKKQHSLIIELVINNLFRLYEHYQKSPPESAMYFRSKELLKIISAFLVYYRSKSVLALGYTLEKTATYIYHEYSGSFEEAVLASKLKNLSELLENIELYHTLISTKLDELSQHIQQTYKTTQYSESSSVMAKQACIFHMEVRCQLMLQDRKYIDLEVFTATTEKNQKLFYSKTGVPVDSSACVALAGLQALLADESIWTTPSLVYFRFNLFYKEICSSAVLPIKKRNKAGQAFFKLAVSIVNTHVYFIIQAAERYNTLRALKQASGVRLSASPFILFPTVAAPVNETQQLSDDIKKHLDNCTRLLDSFHYYTLSGIVNKMQVLSAKSYYYLAKTQFILEENIFDFLRLLSAIPPQDRIPEVITELEALRDRINNICPHAITDINLLSDSSIEQIEKHFNNIINRLVNPPIISSSTTASEPAAAAAAPVNAPVSEFAAAAAPPEEQTRTERRMCG